MNKVSLVNFFWMTILPIYFIKLLLDKKQLGNIEQFCSNQKVNWHQIQKYIPNWVFIIIKFNSTQWCIFDNFCLDIDGHNKTKQFWNFQDTKNYQKFPKIDPTFGSFDGFTPFFRKKTDIFHFLPNINFSDSPWFPNFRSKCKLSKIWNVC